VQPWVQQRHRQQTGGSTTVMYVQSGLRATITQ